MSIEETNGFSAPGEDAHAPGADSLESAPVGQVPAEPEKGVSAQETGQREKVQEPTDAAADDMSAFEEQVEDSDLANALERIASVEDQLARANAELYNQGQEYANFVRRSKEAIPGYKTDGQDEVIEALISVLDDIAAARAHGDLEDGPFASIASKLEDTLKTRFELERYGAEGDDFDPTLHDALMATTSADVDHPVIGQVLTSGYRRGERVVRAAKVLVNNPE
ncbi:molecular chaperone GrpE [Schaalia meyeri]|uniref:Protein GrpE n=1 Tax=Schaalia meyeri TaxID=52773 RepID=A0AAP9Y892_9ACTO|nr:nucleotide exchange factor GrpE [Schaalia meyeri]AKU65824.1 molecular chaperone GrpE [Schaalia meyeri]OFQ22476.1 nucleotide exchange factor GrpE [Actinomyces sp. HMSC062G12]QQC43443.1 nucleotide exchange factor GrpE [Schaalia meyeri]